MLISTDVSIFEIESKEVIYPTDRDDLVNIIRSLLSKNQTIFLGLLLESQSQKL
jgi:hypothetical protein